MAKAKAFCRCATCGNEFTREKICGNRREADSWEAWAENHFDECPDCYQTRVRMERQEENAAAAEANKTAGLPGLTGSPKQVAWAESIRSHGLEYAGSKFSKTSEQAQQILEWLRGQSKAVWWIEHRWAFDTVSGLVELVKESGITAQKEA